MSEFNKDSWWYYFDKIPGTTKAKCKVPSCKKPIIELGKTKGTAPLRSHLNVHHKPLYEQRENAKKEMEQRKEAQQNKLSFNRKIPEIQGFLIFLLIKCN